MTARSRRNERLLQTETFSSVREMAAPVSRLRTPNWHRSGELHYRVRMEAGRVGGCEEKRLWMKITACGSKEAKLHSPFPFPTGKAGRAGFPHAARTAASPARGEAPCAIPQMDALEISLDSERPLMEAVCVNALVRFCAGAISDGRPYRVRVRETRCKKGPLCKRKTPGVSPQRLSFDNGKHCFLAYGLALDLGRPLPVMVAARSGLP